MSAAGNEALPAPPCGTIDPLPFSVRAGEKWYRVHSVASGLSLTEFNPGAPGPGGLPQPQTRFAFFDDARGKKVPVLCAAKTPEAAICESLLHEVPAQGGAIYHADYSTAGMGRFTNSQKLNLAQFMGIGLRRLGLDHRQITSTDASHYDITVQWAQEAHRAGFDGMIWMSHRCNTDEAIVLFGDRVRETELTVDTRYAKIFVNPADEDWLSDMCAPLHIELIHP